MLGGEVKMQECLKVFKLKIITYVERLLYISLMVTTKQKSKIYMYTKDKKDSMQ